MILNPPIYDTNRKVIETFSYNGEEHLLRLHLEVNSRFTDFFVITEGVYSTTCFRKPLKFNASKFPQFIDRIIYIPLFNMPYHDVEATSTTKQANEHYVRDASFNLLEVMARPSDTIIVSDTDEMLSFERFKEFDPLRHEYASTEMQMHVYYFNRRSAYTHPPFRSKQNILYNLTKIATFKTLTDKFGVKRSLLRQKNDCKVDAISKETEG